MTPCKIDDCDKTSRKRGWCNMHYERWRRHGSTDRPTRNSPRYDPFAKIDQSDPNGCWLWTGTLSDDGYGPHRRIYQRLVGPIPKGLHLDHLCRVRHCVNPSHLEPVTPAENLARSRRDNPRPTTRQGATYAVPAECANGHPMSGDNLYIRPKPPSQPRCRTCYNEYMRAYKAERRAGNGAAASGTSPNAA